jgi:hypothetical protein
MEHLYFIWTDLANRDIGQRVFSSAVLNIE